MRFFNFFVAYMVQEYQNESAPIFYYGKSPKTNRKHLKISYLQALALGRLIKMTLYFLQFKKTMINSKYNLFEVKVSILISGHFGRLSVIKFMFCILVAC